MKKIVTMLIATLALSACGNDVVVPKKKDRQDIPLTQTEKEMARSGNEFAYKLFRQVSEPGKNTFLSPISVGYAFAMLNNGAAGKTQQEIQAVLGLKNFSTDEINTYNKKMRIASRDLDPQVKMHTANSIWLRQGFTALQAFKETNQTYYDAAINTIDFTSPDALQQINSWASKQTNGRIPKVLDDIKPEAVIYLLNALSFNGEWSTPFTKENTKEEAFTNFDGSRSTVPMMRRTFNTVCYKGDAFKMISLSYGNSAFYMSILLPDEGKTTASVLAQLDGEGLRMNINNNPNMGNNQVSGYRVHLKLPRFSLNHHQDLVEAMKELGMPSVFDRSKAEFTRLSQNAIYITQAFQKARIEVDEEGTKAEAVTVVGGELTSPGPVIAPELDFFVDRPFVFLIREVSSGAIFFMGEVNRL